MKQKDKISIILPCYNSEKKIKKCMESIINQTYKNIEVIAINDGSGDNTLEILKGFKKKDDRITIISKPNTGVSDSRNIGIEKSNGKYIMFIDSDDYFFVDTVEKMYNKLKETKATVVRGKFRRYESERVIDEGNTSDYNGKTKKDIILDILKGNISCYVWLLLVSKEAIIENKIKFDKSLKIMEDTLFYIEIIEKLNNVYFYDEIIYNYVSNIESVTGNVKNNKKIFYEVIKSLQYIENELKQNKLWDKEIERQMIETYYLYGIADYSWDLFKSKEYKLFYDFLKSVANDKNIQSKLYNINKIMNYKYFIIKLIMHKKIKIVFKIYKIKYIIYKFLRNNKI